MHQRLLLIITDIINMVGTITGSRIWISSIPVIICLGHIFDNPQHPFDDIINIGKIPFHFTMIKYVDWLPGQDGFCKKKIGHIRSSPGTIYRKKTKSSHWQAVKMAIGVGHQFIRFLRSSIERNRMVDIIVNRKRHFAVATIDGTG